MTLPLISICIPVRNDDKHVGAAIESALAQDYPNREILVSDNASVDQTWNVISELENITTVRQPEALPMSTHWNSFRHHAKGEFVLFLCSDDQLCPSALSRCQKSMHAEVDAVFFEYDYLTDAGIQPKPAYYSSSSLIPSTEQHGVLIIGNNFPLSMALIKHETLDEVDWFDESYNFCTDWHLWLKVTAARDKARIAYLAEKLAYYRLHEGNETGRCIMDRRALKEVIRMKDYFLDRLDTNPQRRAEILEKSRRCIFKLACRYSDSMAAIGENNIAEYYDQLSREYEVVETTDSTFSSGAPPYPLPPGSSPLPD